MLQPVWKELAAEAGITPGKPEKPDRKKKKRSPKSHAVAVTPSPELDRLGSHHVRSATIVHKAEEAQQRGCIGVYTASMLL